MKNYFSYSWAVVVLVALFSIPRAGSAQSFSGTWRLDLAQSKDADFFDERGIVMNISKENGDRFTVDQITTTEYCTLHWVTNVELNGPETVSTWPRADLPFFGYEAVAIGENQTVRSKAVQGDDKSKFDLTSTMHTVVSQGTCEVILHTVYQLSPDGNTLTLTYTRSTRENGVPVIFVFHRIN